eukprot:gene12010-25160_t
MLLAPLFLFIGCLLRKNLHHLQETTKYDFVVGKETSKQRLDQYLVTLLPDLSRSYIGELCEEGHVLVNDRKRAKNHKISSEDNISVTVESKISSITVQPENIPLDIIYEDEHIIAINKPPGMVVHPAPGSPNGTFVNALLYYLGNEASTLLLQEVQSKIDIPLDDLDIDDQDLNYDAESVTFAKDSPTSSRPGIVHRLDKGTSGVLLAAKHPEAVTKLSALFSSRKIRKLYLAICVGNPGEATIVEPIGRCKVNRQLMTTYNGPPGKPSTTHLRTLAFDGKFSTVLARIETGRTHQIRVHLKYRRTPIIGDTEYGAVEWNKKLARYNRVTRPLLHAYETQFTHPFTGEEIIIRAPIPSDITKQIMQMTIANKPLLDEKEKFLIVSTEVTGKVPGEANRGLTSIESLRIDEDDFTSYDLPEDPSIFGFQS